MSENKLARGRMNDSFIVPAPTVRILMPKRAEEAPAEKQPGEVLSIAAAVESELAVGR